MALQGETTPASAVLQALLAFSSLHRYGLQSQALELKIAALGSLAKGLGAQTTMQQHIAAGMLLCSFEVHQPSCTAGQWTFHLGGVKTVLNASAVKAPRQLGCDSDMTILLDWVHYHEVVARFSLLHWKRKGAQELLPATPTDLFCAQASNLLSPDFPMLDLLSQVCETVVCSGAYPPGTGASGTVEDYRGFLEVLDWRGDCRYEQPQMIMMILFRMKRRWSRNFTSSLFCCF